MLHIKTIKRGNLQEIDNRDCRECQTSCQSACKTSCTVGNQICRQKIEERR
ncbi:MAG: six-cysteine ranthipeptide SCIFF [Dethiobacteria bacterium]|jgi:predicted ribosomally synthesized six-cysteine peptide SCIFF